MEKAQNSVELMSVGRESLNEECGSVPGSNQEEETPVEHVVDINGSGTEEDTDNSGNEEETNNSETEEDSYNSETEENTSNSEIEEHNNNSENVEEINNFGNEEDANNSEREEDRDNSEDEEDTNNIENEEDTNNSEEKEDTNNFETEEDIDNSEAKEEEDNGNSENKEEEDNGDSENKEEEDINNSENKEEEDINNSENKEDISNTDAQGRISNSQTKQALSSKPLWISRVPDHMRKVDESDYNPKIVSIGPYHHNDPGLKAYEAHKLRLRGHILNQIKEGNALVSLEDAMKKMEEKTRKCYSDSFDNLNSNDFIQMMLLDGLFILELLRLYDKECKGEDVKDQIFSTSWMLPVIGRDLLKQENQLPMFVLQKLFDLMNFDEKATSLNKLALQFFEPLRPGKDKLPNEKLNVKGKYQHLLDLFHSSFDPSDYCPSPKRRDRRNKRVQRPSQDKLEGRNENGGHQPSQNQVERRNENGHGPSPNQQERRDKSDHGSSSQEERRNQRGNLPNQGERKRKNNSRPSLSQRERLINILPGKGWVNNAKSLRGSAIRFRKKSGGLLDIEFKNRILKMPTLFIEDGTSSVLRNLLAYEQCNRYAARYFTCLAVFFDSLVDTDEDLKVLRKAGILKQARGSDEEMVNFLNSLTKELEFGIDDCLMIKLIEDINRCCRSWKSRIMSLLYQVDFMKIMLAYISFIQSILTYTTYSRRGANRYINVPNGVPN